MRCHVEGGRVSHPPPCTLISAPLTYEASELQRNAMAAATSSGRPGRPGADMAMFIRSTYGSTCETKSVSMVPGKTAFDVIPRRAVSSARLFDIPSRAAFVLL